MGKLTKAQAKLLAILADSRQPMSIPELSARGVNGTTTWALERRELVQVDRFANGLHVSITPAGRTALAEHGEKP